MSDMPAGSHDPERDVRLLGDEMEQLAAISNASTVLGAAGEPVYTKRLILNASNPPLEAFWLADCPENVWAVDWLDKNRKRCLLTEQEHAQLVRESTRERAVTTAWGSTEPRLLVAFGNQWAWDRLFHIRMAEGRG